MRVWPEDWNLLGIPEGVSFKMSDTDREDCRRLLLDRDIGAIQDDLAEVAYSGWRGYCQMTDLELLERAYSVVADSEVDEDRMVDQLVLRAMAEGGVARMLS